MTEPRLILGDCVEALAAMEASSIDAVVCDPPYLISFMGKEFDSQDGAHADPKKMQDWHELWAREALRVLKPGGYLLAFGGTRTYHRLAAGIEDAGFEIRDCIMWLYGSGFPKSLDVSKAIDKAQGVEGAYGDFKTPDHAVQREVPSTLDSRPWHDDPDAVDRNLREYHPGSAEARKWVGWGTALKPAVEPIVVARKPLVGTVAANVLAYGTGALNIAATRIGTTKDVPASPRRAEQGAAYGDLSNAKGDEGGFDPNLGRWPANVILSHTLDVRVGDRQVAADGHWPAARPAGSGLAGASGHAGQDELAERAARGETVEVWECADDCPVHLLDAQVGELRSGEPGTMRAGENRGAAFGAESRPPGTPMTGYGDAGGASRFFYCAKTSRAERSAGLDGFEAKALNWSSGEQNPGSFQGAGTKRETANHHPTVKPLDLMRWLVRLVARPGALACDPFLGSGTTGIACGLEGVDFVGIEREADYLAIAEARIRFWAEHGKDALRIVAERERGGAAEARPRRRRPTRPVLRLSRRFYVRRLGHRSVRDRRCQRTPSTPRPPGWTFALSF